MANDDKSKRFSFKSDVKYDIALLTEVEQLNPFSFKTPKKVWQEIAQNLLTSDLKMGVTERSCRERAALLLKEFKKDESLSQRSTGIDENDMDQLKQLLTSVLKLSQTPKTSAVQKLYSTANRTEAEKEREAALLNMEIGTDSGDEAEIIEDGSNVSVTEPSAGQITPTSTVPKRVRKGDVVDYLEKKNKSEIEFRKEELELKKFEAETRRMEIQMTKEKNDMDFKAKMEELELKRAAESAQNEERLAMTKALLDVLKNK